MNDTELDALLAPPSLSEPPRLAQDLALLAEDARRRAARVRPAPRIVAAGAALALALGGAAVAAAATGMIDWSPWAQDAPSNHYVLPSGIECEFRIGAVTGDPEAVAAAEDIIAHTDFVSDLDIEQALAEMNARERPSDWDADRAYNEAVASAANTLFFELLAARGYSMDAGDITSAQMEGQCPGAAR